MSGGVDLVEDEVAGAAEQEDAGVVDAATVSAAADGGVVQEDERGVELELEETRGARRFLRHHVPMRTVSTTTSGASVTA